MEKQLRIHLVGPSLLALALTLSACGEGTSPANQSEQAQGPIARPAWTDTMGSQLRKSLEGRAAHGLDRMQFELPATGADDAALTRTALAYAKALASGASDPKKLFEVYTVPLPKPDLEQGLARAMRDGKLDAWLESLAPQDENYRRLSTAYVALRKSASAAPAEGAPAAGAIPDAGKSIDPGATDPRIPLIARQLAASDYIDQAPPGETYAPALVDAVKRMQADYGIKSDGIIGSDALQILNLSDEDRARAIAVNMERLRWLERTPPTTRIDVNIASTRLSYWRDGKLADTRRVVAGDPETETPQLGSPIYRLVANPTWTVPRSIQQKEITGKGAAYMKRNNMVWKDGWVVQQPGPKNSLGLVKFDMQNDHAIYLHDTPAKPLFAEIERHRSHGCVRVEDALGFAKMLADDAGITADWDKARATGKEGFVSLPKPLPVRLLYLTVLFDQKGEPIVRADPYGWDARVGTAIGFPEREGRQVKGGAADVGP